MVNNQEEKIDNGGDKTVTDDTVENNKNDNIDDVGVVYESLSEKNNDDYNTVDDNTVDIN